MVEAESLILAVRVNHRLVCAVHGGVQCAGRNLGGLSRLAAVHFPRRGPRLDCRSCPRRLRHREHRSEGEDEME